MPEARPMPPGADRGAELFDRIVGNLAGQVLGGEVPEKDKAAILDDLVADLDELLAINRYFAQNVWDKFGDEDTGELSRKPDVRDFLSAWALATMQAAAGPEEEEPPEGGEEPEGGEGEPGAAGDDVIEADYRVVPEKGGKKA